MSTLKFDSADGEILIETSDSASGFQYVGAKGLAPRQGSAEEPDEVISAGRFEIALSRIKPIGDTIANTISAFAVPPENLEVEFSLKFTAGAGVIVAKAGSEAQMKVKIAWSPKK